MTTDAPPPIVSPEEWEAARLALRDEEKALTRARDALAARRRRMPWMPVEDRYRFEGPDGPRTLRELFDGRRQLLVYRAFYEPGVAGWPERGCVGCSLMADHVGRLEHLHARDTTFVFASRAPQPRVHQLQREMGWEHIPWYTLTDGFDADFGVAEWHGTNAFVRDGDDVFRSYFINGRGDEWVVHTWSHLDLTAFGRQEEWEDSPSGTPQTAAYTWWKRHDAYDEEHSAAHLEQIARALASDEPT